MTSGRDHFVEFQDHTLLKHLILERYLEAWAIKLLQWGGAGDEVWFVDAFAGEGADHSGNPGSPVIAGNLAAGVLERRGVSRDGHPPMRVLAIELEPKRCDLLRGRTAEHQDKKVVEVRCGTLHEFLDKFVDHVKNAPVLYFLDPFGVEGLVAADLPKLFKGGHNEVFALFSHVGARRLLATLLTPDRNVEYEVEQILDEPSLFPEITEEAAQAKRTEGERSNRALRDTRTGAERILGEALGKGGIKELEGVPAEDRQLRATQVYMRLLEEAGAKYVISFPVRNDANQQVYQLLHASKSKQGFRTMKESMDTALKRSSLSAAARAAMTFEVTVPFADLLRQLRMRFGGETVRWTDGNNRGAITTVKKYLLEETPVFPAQIGPVRDVLVEAGYRETARPLTFRFPREP